MTWICSISNWAAALLKKYSWQVFGDADLAFKGEPNITSQWIVHVTKAFKRSS